MRRPSRQGAVHLCPYIRGIAAFHLLRSSQRCAPGDCTAPADEDLPPSEDTSSGWRTKVFATLSSFIFINSLWCGKSRIPGFVGQASRNSFLALLLLSGCYEPENKRPEIHIAFVREATQSLMVDVNVETFGSKPVVEYGIAYGEVPSPLNTGSKYVFSGERKRFHTCTLNNLKINTAYYLRAYVIDQDSTITYSPEVSATTLLHVLRHFYPTLATVSDEITIVGKNFVPNNTRVFMAGVETKARVSTDTIWCFPPFGLEEDSVTISVEIAGSTRSFSYPLIHRKGRWTKLRSLDSEDENILVGWGFFGLGVSGRGYVSSMGDHLTPHVIRAYDPATETWQNQTFYPDQVNKISQWFSLYRQIFVMGENQTFSMYDPDADLWYTLPDHPIANWYGISGVAFSSGRYGYAGLGKYWENQTSALWRFDYDTFTWTPITNFPGRAAYNVLALVSNGTAYFIGGSEYVDNVETAFREAWKYDLEANVWSRIPDYPGAGKVELSGVVLNNKVYAGGGCDITYSNTYEYDFWEYDPQSNRWTRVADIPLPGASMYSYVVGADGYLGGGRGRGSRWSFKVMRFEVN